MFLINTIRELLILNIVRFTVHCKTYDTRAIYERYVYGPLNFGHRHGKFSLPHYCRKVAPYVLLINVMVQFYTKHVKMNYEYEL